MNILDKIIARKKVEVDIAKQVMAIKDLESANLFARETYSISDFIRQPDRTGIIAEIKRQSPSKGVINANVVVEGVAIGYYAAGASALSVLTDKDFFGAHDEDFNSVRAVSNIPMLRKDFIIDEYQVIETKSWGADVILLIAAVLSKAEIEHLGSLAQHLGMEVLLEVHNVAELQESLTDKVNLIGVNNRNLKTFATDVKTSYDLVEQIPSDFIKVSESGIDDPAVIKALKQVGYEGFLIGENFMKHPNPASAAKHFMQRL